MSDTRLRIATAFHRKTEGSVSAPGGSGKGWRKAVHPPMESAQGVGLDKGVANLWGGEGDREEGGERMECGPACHELTQSECGRHAFSQCLSPVQAALGTLSQQNTGLALAEAHLLI